MKPHNKCITRQYQSHTPHPVSVCRTPHITPPTLETHNTNKESYLCAISGRRLSSPQAASSTHRNPAMFFLHSDSPPSPPCFSTTRTSFSRVCVPASLRSAGSEAARRRFAEHFPQTSDCAARRTARAPPTNRTQASATTQVRITHPAGSQTTHPTAVAAR